jgi:WhiB family redox-sensing transcriptional regulator
LSKPPKYPKTVGSEPCATTDPEIWFPERSNQYLKVMAIAKSLCRTCPIMYECAQYAIHTDVEGIWGGTNEKERKAIQQANGIEVFRFVKIMSQMLDQMAAPRGN